MPNGGNFISQVNNMLCSVVFHFVRHFVYYSVRVRAVASQHMQLRLIICVSHGGKVCVLRNLPKITHTYLLHILSQSNSV